MSSGTRRLCSRRWFWNGLVPAAVLAVLIGLTGCNRSQPPARPKLATPTPPMEVASVEEDAPPTAMPSAIEAPLEDAPIDAAEIPRFAANSPFDTDYEPPKVKQEKRLWARSFLWSKAPDFVVEQWLADEPEMEGKYLLIEFWATWCGPCRRSIPLLNGLHQKYGEELVVIGISDEAEEDVLKMKEPTIEFFSAVDTQARMKDELGVMGIPHAIILEPDGYVIWEGFPLLEGHELTEEIIEKILEVGRKLKAEASDEQ